MEPARIYDYTEKDYYNLPDNLRAELIDGRFYNMEAPNRVHQEIVHFFDTKIGNYIDSKKGPCKVYPAPFAVKLFNDRKNIVNRISVSSVTLKSSLTKDAPAHRIGLLRFFHQIILLMTM